MLKWPIALSMHRVLIVAKNIYSYLYDLSLFILSDSTRWKAHIRIWVILRRCLLSPLDICNRNRAKSHAFYRYHFTVSHFIYFVQCKTLQCLSWADMNSRSEKMRSIRSRSEDCDMAYRDSQEHEKVIKTLHAKSSAFLFSFSRFCLSKFEVNALLLPSATSYSINEFMETQNKVISQHVFFLRIKAWKWNSLIQLNFA